MVHLMLHLPEQVLLTGPVRYTWCYPNERQLGDYKKTNRNKRFPEGSITAAYISSECVTFYKTYLNDEHTGGESSGGGNQFHLSVVSDEVQPYGRLGREYRLSREELKEAHWCVLQHCDELEDYLEKHLSRQNGNEAIHERDFPDYFPIWVRSSQVTYNFNLFLIILFD
uniref:uncharacterized protein LOC101310926 n=1 Tax=Fragaria vesca subsp. vesca TaxID=101020 RepID=UPI0005CAF897|nr:PREDICTED: uncharacterized protein LOC101310926 [Fragaria vesca subsp. vesca]